MVARATEGRLVMVETMRREQARPSLEDEVEQLREALNTNREIATAIGILMVRCQTDQRGAFDILSQNSQRTNVKVRDVAARIVASEERLHARRPRRQP